MEEEHEFVDLTSSTYTDDELDPKIATSASSCQNGETMGNSQSLSHNATSSIQRSSLHRSLTHASEEIKNRYNSSRPADKTSHDHYSKQDPRASTFNMLPTRASKLLSHSMERKRKATEDLEMNPSHRNSSSRPAGISTMVSNMTKSSQKTSAPPPVFKMPSKSPEGVKGLECFDEQDEEPIEVLSRKRVKTHEGSRRSPDTSFTREQPSPSSSGTLTSEPSISTSPPQIENRSHETDSTSLFIDSSEHQQPSASRLTSQRAVHTSGEMKKPATELTNSSSQGERTNNEQPDHSRVSSHNPPKPKLPKNITNPPYDMIRLVATLQEVPHIITGIQNQYAELFRNLAEKVNAQENQIKGLQSDNNRLRRQMDTMGAEIVNATNDRVDEIERRFNEKMQELIDSNDEVMLKRDPVEGGPYGGPKFAPPKKMPGILESMKDLGA